VLIFIQTWPQAAESPNSDKLVDLAVQVYPIHTDQGFSNFFFCDPI